MSWQGQIQDMFSNGGNSMMNSSSNASSPFDWRKALSGGLSGIAGMAGGMMSGNGFDQMSNYIGQGKDAVQNNFDQGSQYLQPYNQAGMNAMGQYSQALNGMSNPVGYMNNIMSQYQQSPQAQFETQEMQRASNNSAAAGGQLGSPAQQMAVSRYQNQISNADQQRFFNNAQGINNQYLGGLQGLTGQGFNAAGQMNQNRMGLGDDLATLLQNMGLSQGMSDKSVGGGIGNLIGGLGSLAMFL